MASSNRQANNKIAVFSKITSLLRLLLASAYVIDESHPESNGNIKIVSRILFSSLAEHWPVPLYDVILAQLLHQTRLPSQKLDLVKVFLPHVGAVFCRGAI
jgi:hypothetical protein